MSLRLNMYVYKGWYMVTLSEEQRNIIGWVVTVGISVGLTALNILIVYCFYCVYRVIKNFSKRYWHLIKVMIYIITRWIADIHILSVGIHLQIVNVLTVILYKLKVVFNPKQYQPSPKKVTVFCFSGLTVFEGVVE
jgi:hypothetical protein